MALHLFQSHSVHFHIVQPSSIGALRRRGEKDPPSYVFLLKVIFFCVVTLLVVGPAWSFWVNGKILP